MSEPFQILLAKDHRPLADSVGAYLEAVGFVVDYAADGLTAMHLAATQRYDAIVLDIGLPGVNGLEIRRSLRRDHSPPANRYIRQPIRHRRSHAGCRHRRSEPCGSPHSSVAKTWNGRCGATMCRTSDALRSHRYNLRRQVDRGFDQELLETVSGLGFHIRAP